MWLNMTGMETWLTVVYTIQMVNRRKTTVGSVNTESDTIPAEIESNGPPMIRRGH